MNLTVFDLDHTLLNANSSYRFGAYLYRKKFFSFFSLLACLTYYTRHKLLRMPLQKVHQKTFLSIFRGHSLREIERHAKAFVEQELAGMLHLPVLCRLREAQKQGDYTVILSSSPDFLVRPIAEALGIHDWQSGFDS